MKMNKQWSFPQRKARWAEASPLQPCTITSGDNFLSQDSCNSWARCSSYTSCAGRPQQAGSGHRPTDSREDITAWSATSPQHNLHHLILPDKPSQPGRRAACPVLAANVTQPVTRSSTQGRPSSSPQPGGGQRTGGLSSPRGHFQESILFPASCPPCWITPSHPCPVHPLSAPSHTWFSRNPPGRGARGEAALRPQSLGRGKLQHPAGIAAGPTSQPSRRA